MNIPVADPSGTKNLLFKRRSIAQAWWAALTVVVVLIAQPASAASILVNRDGQLIGATGVNVAGSFYDVSFTDASCVAVYDGCDAVSDFVFTTQSDAAVASQALLNQVFVDGPDGLFDTVPGLTSGCLDTSSTCYVWTPYAFVTGSAGEDVLSVGAVNRIAGDGTNVGRTQPALDFGSFNRGFATAGYSFIWADWSPGATPTAVPEPASMLLLGTGLAGIGMRHRRQGRA